MSKQPKALQLAAAIEMGCDYAPTLGGAANELRRQHALIQQLSGAFLAVLDESSYDIRQRFSNLVQKLEDEGTS